MELEALQGIYSDVKALGAEIVVLAPEIERYTRNLHKKLSLPFDILTDLHLKTAEEFSHCVRIAGLFEGALQVLWKRLGQVPR
jgi:peroxiredoxin